MTAHPAGCICGVCRPRPSKDGEGLLGLPPCPVTQCDNCGKGLADDLSWIHKGYGCSACRGMDPLQWINDNGRLSEALSAAESRAQRAEAEAKEWEARAELAARLVTDGPYAKDAARLMDLRLRESDLEERAQRAEERLQIATKALNWIAAWDEGAEVTGSFDCPVHATAARAALAEVDREGKA